MKDQLIQEIISNGKLKKYESTVRLIVKEIIDFNCKISVRYNSEASVTEMDPKGLKPPHIRISLKNKEKPIRIIWDILHEFGHCKSGPRAKTDTNSVREKLAWHHAEKVFQKYPDLKKEHNDFLEYKEICLKTYM